MGTPTVALLTFSRENTGPTLELVHRLSGHVDEVLVVDSSADRGWKALVDGLHRPNARAVRAIPTGYADLLQPLGVDSISSDWVFYCDPDEEPSAGLLERLAHLEGSDAYIVPRFEQVMGAYTPHLRLYRRRCFTAPDPAYAFPSIQGKVAKLDRSESLVHRRDYGTSLQEDYGTGTIDVESFERPNDVLWFRRQLWPVRLGTGPDRERPPPVAPSRRLSPPAAALAAGIASVRALAASGSPHWAAFQWNYHRARGRFESGLLPRERDRRAAIAQATRTSGGMIRYLGFDRPEYVRALSASFTWDLDGLAVLHRLLGYRFDQGVPMPRWVG